MAIIVDPDQTACTRYLKTKLTNQKTEIKSDKMVYNKHIVILIESMMGLRSRQGNLRLVFRLFSLMRGLLSIRLN